MFELYLSIDIMIRVDLVQNAKLKADKDGHRRLISTKVKIVDCILPIKVCCNKMEQ